jgi:hypothetical protein
MLFFFEMGSYYTAKSVLKLTILLPQPPEMCATIPSSKTYAVCQLVKKGHLKSNLKCTSESYST